MLSTLFVLGAAHTELAAPPKEAATACPDGENWVNQMYDNPGKTTCECYPVNDQCLTDKHCELKPECGSYAAGLPNVVYQGDTIPEGAAFSDEEFNRLVKLTHHGPGAAMGRSGFDLADWKNAVIKSLRLPKVTPARLRCDEETRGQMSDDLKEVMGDCVESPAELVKLHGLGSIAPSWAPKTTTLACEPMPVGKVDVSCHRLNCEDQTLVCHNGHGATVYEALTTDGGIVNLHCHDWTDAGEAKLRCHAVAEGDRLYMTKPSSPMTHHISQ